MFLKRLERRKNGKRHTCWALVESVRTAGGSRHRVVAYLGELTARESSGWAHLARRLDREDRPQPTLFDPLRRDKPAEDEPVLVNRKGVRLQRLRDFGDAWLALGLWRLLGLDGLLSHLMPAGREDVPWPVVASILAVARFCDPDRVAPRGGAGEGPRPGVPPGVRDVWKTLSAWMRGGGLGDAPRTVLEEFARITSGDVVLRTRTADGRPGKALRLRCVTSPDEGQRVLLSRLGLTLPQRLCRLDEVAPM